MVEPGTVVVAAACVPGIKFDRAANCAAAAAQVAALAVRGAQVVVLPEACIQGYITEEPSLTQVRRRPWRHSPAPADIPRAYPLCIQELRTKPEPEIHRVDPEFGSTL